MATYLPVLLVSVNAGMPDDASLQPLPRGQVDYLSHEWDEEDVWRSWRNMTKQKNEIANGVRLENASWRTWWKQRNRLRTVSNKTWQSISNVPIRTINRLELFALSMLKHDLSVGSDDWDRWLHHLHHHHLSLFPYPAPIQRPSSLDPNTFVRKVLEGLLDAHVPLEHLNKRSPPHPIFYSLSSSSTRKVTTQTEAIDQCGFDFDEDGPLREEYILKRPLRGEPDLKCIKEPVGLDVKQALTSLVPVLPPPSEWSPQADPPLNPGRKSNEMPAAGFDHGSQRPHSGFLAPATFWNTAQAGPLATAKSKLSQTDFLPSTNRGFALGPIYLPITHAMSGLPSAAPLPPVIPGHGPTYSYPYPTANEYALSTSSCAFNNPCLQTIPFMLGDAAHFRPLCLRT